VGSDGVLGGELFGLARPVDRLEAIGLDGVEGTFDAGVGVEVHHPQQRHERGTPPLVGAGLGQEVLADRFGAGRHLGLAEAVVGELELGVPGVPPGDLVPAVRVAAQQGGQRQGGGEAHEFVGVEHAVGPEVVLVGVDPGQDVRVKLRLLVLVHVRGEDAVPAGARVERNQVEGGLVVVTGVDAKVVAHPRFVGEVAGDDALGTGIDLLAKTGVRVALHLAGESLGCGRAFLLPGVPLLVVVRVQPPVQLAHRLARHVEAALLEVLPLLVALG
jgi:hypothetical protein